MGVRVRYGELVVGRVNVFIIVSEVNAVYVPVLLFPPRSPSTPLPGRCFHSGPGSLGPVMALFSATHRYLFVPSRDIVINPPPISYQTNSSCLLSKNIPKRLIQNLQSLLNLLWQHCHRRSKSENTTHARQLHNITRQTPSHRPIRNRLSQI